MTTPPPNIDAVDYIQVTADTYRSLGYDGYRWADNTSDPAPFATPSKPLSECRVALIASGGVYRLGDIGFTHKDDISFRAIPSTTPTNELRVTHFAYDQANARADINVVFPIDALRSLESAGEIGELAPSALTFMGGIYSQRRLRDSLIPQLVDAVVEMDVDLALLVPV